MKYLFFISLYIKLEKIDFHIHINLCSRFYDKLLRKGFSQQLILSTRIVPFLFLKNVKCYRVINYIPYRELCVAQSYFKINIKLQILKKSLN